MLKENLQECQEDLYADSFVDTPSEGILDGNPTDSFDFDTYMDTFSDEARAVINEALQTFQSEGVLSITLAKDDFERSDIPTERDSAFKQAVQYLRKLYAGKTISSGDDLIGAAESDLARTDTQLGYRTFLNGLLTVCRGLSLFGLALFVLYVGALIAVGEADSIHPSQHHQLQSLWLVFREYIIRMLDSYNASSQYSKKKKKYDDYEIDIK